MKRLTLLFIFLLTLGSVSAQFDAFGDTALTFEPCTTHTRNLTIHNTGSEAANYEIAVDGDASELALFSATEFTLQSGQSGIITQTFRIPCEATADTLALDVFFSDGTEEKTLPQTIQITLPDTINVTATTASQVIAPCQSATYPITISNSANFTELYTLAASGHDDVHLSHPALVLLPKSQQTIELSVTPTDCTQSGSFPLTLAITSEKSRQQKQLTFELIVTPTDIPELSVGVSSIRTDFGDHTAELSIKNLGDRPTTYELALTGALWATISPKTVTLKAGQTLPLQLRLNPEETVTEDTYPLTLTATVLQTGIAYTKELTINLKRPGYIEQNPAYAVALALAGLLILAILIMLVRYVRTDTFKERYANWKMRRAEKREARARKREEKRALKLERKAERALAKEEARAKREAEHKKAEAEEARLAEQRERAREKLLEKKELALNKLRAQTEKNLAKEYHLVSRKAAKASKERRKTVLPFLILSLLALGLLLAFAWPFIAPNLGAIALGLALLALIWATRKIARRSVIHKRLRIVPQDAPFTLNAWKRGLRQLRITAEKPVKNLRIMLRRHRVSVKPSPHTLDTFTLKTNADTRHLATFAVSKRLLKRHHASLEELRVAKYANGTWKTVSFDRAGEDSENLFVNCPIGTGTHAIYLKLKKQEQPRKGRGLIICGIAILAIAVLLALGTRTSNPSGVIPQQVWKQDTIHTFDLAPFFNDPDGDTLTFATTPTKNIAIDFIGTKAVLTPANGFSGEERVRFIATDSDAAAIESNTVSLIVVDTILPVQYRPAFSVFLGIVAVVALLLTLRGLQLGQQKKK